MKIFSTVFISLIIFLSSAFSQSKNYYPLKIGKEWKYQSQNGEFERKLIVVSYDDNYDAFLLKEILKLGTTLPVTNQILIENRNGSIIQLGTQGGLFNTDWAFNSSIVLSNDLSVGSKWYEQYNGMNDQIVADTLTINVKAGLFHNVIKVERELISYDKKLKRKIISMKVFDYYAPNVGLIKECTYDLKKKIERIYIELVNFKGN